MFHKFLLKIQLNIAKYLQNLHTNNSLTDLAVEHVNLEKINIISSRRNYVEAAQDLRRNESSFKTSRPVLLNYWVLSVVFVEKEES